MGIASFAIGGMRRFRGMFLAPRVWARSSQRGRSSRGVALGTWMEEDGGTGIARHLSILPSFFRERNSIDEVLISYPSSPPALVRFRNASHETFADSLTLNPSDCGGSCFPAMGSSTLGEIMGKRPWARVINGKGSPEY